MKRPVASFLRFSAILLSVPLSVFAAAACGTAGLDADAHSKFTSSGFGNGGASTGSAAGGAHASSGQGGSANGGSASSGFIFDSGFSDGPTGVCVPKTCVELNATCGPQGDGCGNLIQCGNCTAPATCGGGNPSVASQCGTDTCVLKTCADWGANCGPVSDGCGGILQCGTCTGSETCGGGGTPSQCGGDMGCVPTTCATANVNCGPIGDGCGGLIPNCGTCALPQTCGGGGVPGQCGNGVVDASLTCTPLTCAEQKINCGPAGDGCGGVIADCGTCAAPETCGGGGTPGQCGGTAGCKPATCTTLGYNCGPAGDGCGGKLDCGTCTSPATCGGGGPGVCGQNKCVPKTCAQLGFNCGPAGDGCGGVIECGSSCVPGEACGAGGVPGVCGPLADGGGSTCTGLCQQQVSCADAGPRVTTTITGTVYAPNGVDPIYNALVYIPNAPVLPFVPGVTCQACGADISGSPLVSTNTAADGSFQLQNVPVGTNIPVVIQLGRWRRQLVIPQVTACTNTAPAAPFFRLPKSQAEGDIPLIAMVTGNADSLECVLRGMGIADIEFTDPPPALLADGGVADAGTPGYYYGRVQMYVSNGANSPTKDAPSVTQLFTNQATMNAYDIIALSCDGTPNFAVPPTAGSPNNVDLTTTDMLLAYANEGGRVFTTHYSYVWLDQYAPFSGTAAWQVGQANPPDPLTSFVDFTNPRGQAFAQWSMIVGASAEYGQLGPIHVGRHDFNSVNAAEGQRWLYWYDTGPDGGPQQVPLHYTFNTPIGTAPANQCGRVLFTDFHEDDVGTSPTTAFPTECAAAGTPLNQQEHLLEFMMFDIDSCVTDTVPPPLTCTPRTCAQQNITCGPAGDGCGNELQCGNCTAPQTCGGGGTPGQCGGGCVPLTCASQNIACGPASDGCGNLLQCGNCPNGQTCGGGGVSGQCGAATCVPETCKSQGFQCGPAGDGCGGELQCGNCPPGETCGGGGTPGVCAGPDASACKPSSCMAQGIQCGPAGDGCGGELQCGACVAPQTCGGGGMPGVCGAPVCVPTTCQAQGIECGPTGDGCGGEITSCGTCPANETCGGCGAPGKCGSCCVPTTCKAIGYTCGPAGDGCGGTLQCGTCTAPDTCGGAGVYGQCGRQTTN